MKTKAEKVFEKIATTEKKKRSKPFIGVVGAGAIGAGVGGAIGKTLAEKVKEQSIKEFRERAGRFQARGSGVDWRLPRRVERARAADRGHPITIKQWNLRRAAKMLRDDKAAIKSSGRLGLLAGAIPLGWLAAKLQADSYK